MGEFNLIQKWDASEGSGGEDNTFKVVATVSMEDFSATLDKTWKEIDDAIQDGKLVYITEWMAMEGVGSSGFNSSNVNTVHQGNVYAVYLGANSINVAEPTVSITVFYADTANDYPVNIPEE